jgi:hypothetical protein
MSKACEARSEGLGVRRDLLRVKWTPDWVLAMLSLCLSAMANVDASSPERFVSTYSTEVSTHISLLMPLVIDETKNMEWNPRMSTQRTLLTAEHGRIVYQIYKLPWPLLDRELLMRCNRDIDTTALRVTTRCHSVHHASLPISHDRVRMEILGSVWVLTAKPGGITHLQLTLAIPAAAAHGLPKPIVDYVQRNSLKDSINSFLAAVDRLQLPPQYELSGWHAADDAPSIVRQDRPKRIRAVAQRLARGVTRLITGGQKAATEDDAAREGASTSHTRKPGDYQMRAETVELMAVVGAQHILGVTYTQASGRGCHVPLFPEVVDAVARKITLAS